MSVSLRRIRQLAVLFGLGLAMVVAHLTDVMVVDHDAWLQRSYRNRWAFRDVPTRRGSVQDREGRWLTADQPCAAVELHYWAFRRYHPVGAAIEGANLALDCDAIRLPGLAHLDYRDPRHATAALHLLVAVGVDKLRAEVSGKDNARDLRFYLSSLLSSLTNASHSQIGRQLRQAAAAGSQEPACHVLGLDPRELRALFAVRLQELVELDRRVRAGDRRAEVLWEVLESARAKRIEWLGIPKANRKRAPPDQKLCCVADGLAFEVILYLASIQERHPGLLVHASVRRVRNTLPGRSGLASLEPFLGRVTPVFWRADQQQRDQQLLEQQLDQMAVELDELSEEDVLLSDRLRELVRDRAHKAVQGYLRRGRVGTSGVEKELDLPLRGGPGLRFVERSRRTPERKLLGSFDVTPGLDCRLTFDLRLQALLEQALDEGLASLERDQAAAMAVVNMRGDVLALASRPLDKLPAAVFWPSAGNIGSVGKPFVLLEHLDAMRRGRPHKPHREYHDCVGSYGPRLGCDHSHLGDARDPVKALGESCNFFFYQAAEGLHGEGVLAAYARFGLAPGGRHQQRIPGLWLRNPVKTERSHRDPRRLAIGYGIQANVLTMARAYAGLATGRLPGLSFVLDGHRPGTVELGLHPDDLAVVRDGMEHCVREGTAAREAGLRELGVLAKTGTATVGEPRSKINNAWLAGYLTRERPTLAFAAVVYGVRGYGAARAGPLVIAFLEKLRNDPQLWEIFR